MADFALWATACETALWPPGTFWGAYCGNRDSAVDAVLDADPVAAAIRTLMVTRSEWTGTASELLGALGDLAGERLTKSRAWPDSPRALGGRVRRAATFLRTIGIETEFSREGRVRTRAIRFTTTTAPTPERGPTRPSASSASSEPDVGPAHADVADGTNRRTVPGGADGVDAHRPTQSGWHGKPSPPRPQRVRAAPQTAAGSDEAGASHEDFEERAAILEFEAGLSRAEAEYRARALLRARSSAQN